MFLFKSLHECSYNVFKRTATLNVRMCQCWLSWTVAFFIWHNFDNSELFPFHNTFFSIKSLPIQQLSFLEHNRTKVLDMGAALVEDTLAEGELPKKHQKHWYKVNHWRSTYNIYLSNRFNIVSNSKTDTQSQDFFLIFLNNTALEPPVVRAWEGWTVFETRSHKYMYTV